MNKQEAEKLLNKSRKKIDEIDEQIFNLILERTSLAPDIISSKKALDMDLFDKSREDIIHDKLENLMADVEYDKEIIFEIFDMLAKLSKQEQKKYLN
ncbi:MAG: chorismate mutase [Methanosphaera sp.]|mgnify:CR=1 FL=1|uniref:chorismate mutase n=1 Tax=Methanosphaera sp. TaxID=2666342 RepID=UPI0025E0B958|nr:chorismate mutase [Methanosphaera sp.]MCI5867654.1 chorismate mutase [Methanosphaera sp.]MDD6534122.1 chorismate mutase [Methanosphaera sp.]MDY3956069.1 chorismate mutase [Methanosphaera sp.]